VLGATAPRRTFKHRCCRVVERVSAALHPENSTLVCGGFLFNVVQAGALQFFRGQSGWGSETTRPRSCESFCHRNSAA
jgi:hypothetical protein